MNDQASVYEALKVNPRLHAVPRFVFDDRQNSLSFRNRNTTFSTIQATSSNNNVQAERSFGSRHSAGSTLSRAGVTKDPMKTDTNFLKQYKLYKESVIRTKPASLFRHNGITCSTRTHSKGRGSLETDYSAMGPDYMHAKIGLAQSKGSSTLA